MHPCDYKSRTEKGLDMKAVVFKLVVRTLAEHKGWSDTGKREYCLSHFQKMGLTAGEYERILKWFNEH